MTGVTVAETANGSCVLDVQSERGTDVRREVARTVVSSGWGLLELSPLRVSLEDVFLQLTTSEEPKEEDADPGPAQEPADTTEDPT